MQQQIQDALANANSLATEIISSIRTVRSFANEAGESENYYQKMKVAYLLQFWYNLENFTRKVYSVIFHLVQHTKILSLYLDYRSNKHFITATMLAST